MENAHQGYHRGMWYYITNNSRVYFDSRTQILLETEYSNRTQNLTFYDVNGGTNTVNLLRMEMNRNETTTYRVVREDPMSLIVPIQYDGVVVVQSEMTETGAVGVGSEDLPELELTESDVTDGGSSDELTEPER